MARAFAGIEYQLRLNAFEPMMVRVAVQREVMLCVQRAVELARIVHDDDVAAMPDQCQRRFDETESAFGNRCVQRIAFLIVVAEHTPQRCVEPRESVDGFCLRDVAGVDHAVDARCVEQLDDPSRRSCRLLWVSLTMPMRMDRKEGRRKTAEPIGRADRCCVVRRG